MKVQDYVTLKSKSAVSFSKANDSDVATRYYLTQKAFDSMTGEAKADNKSEVQLDMYKADLEHANTDITSATARKEGLTKIIEYIDTNYRFLKEDE